MRALDYFRMFLGFIIFWNAITQIKEVHALTQAQGYFPFKTYKAGRPKGFSILDFFPQFENAAIIVTGLLCFVSVLFGFGYYTPYSTIVLYILLISLNRRTFIVRGSDDYLMIIFIFFLIFYDLGFTKSALLLLKLQVSTVYLHAFFHKMKQQNWRDGTAIRNTVLRQEWGREWIKVRMTPRLSKALTYFTLACQFLIPIMLWIPYLKILAIVLGVVLHLGMMLTLRLGTFAPLMITAYLLFLQ